MKDKDFKNLDAILPSIWVNRYENYSDWRKVNDNGQISLLFSLADNIEDRLILSRHNMTHHAYCSACNSLQQMTLTWKYGGINEMGSVHPSWTETPFCNTCGLNSRMRALISLLKVYGVTESSRIFIPEQVTGAFSFFQKQYPGIVGAEYLGDALKSGTKKISPNLKGILRHEDITRLSFDDASFDVIITQHVFEHIPDFEAAFRECHRVLAPGGRMFFTIPFYSDTDSIEIIALKNANGIVTHLTAPEYHGNPVSDGGSLCFQHFGWGILDSLRKAGFQSCYAHQYWGPWQGHFGIFSFVFSAERV